MLQKIYFMSFSIEIVLQRQSIIWKSNSEEISWMIFWWTILYMNATWDMSCGKIKKVSVWITFYELNRGFWKSDIWITSIHIFYHHIWISVISFHFCALLNPQNVIKFIQAHFINDVKMNILYQIIFFVPYLNLTFIIKMKKSSIT